MFYATNALDLLESRKNGMAPEGPVVVSLVAGEYGRPTLYLRDEMPIARMDWRMLVNLEVWVWATAKASLERLVATTWAIAQARPKALHSRFEAGDSVHDVDCGFGQHMPAVLDIAAIHQFFWQPINVSGSELGSRLKKALTTGHPGRVVL